MTTSVFHVLPVPKGGWAVRRSRAGRSAGTFVTKAAAIKAASALAKRQAPAQVVIHDAAGRIVGDRMFSAATKRKLRSSQQRSRQARATRERTRRRAQRQTLARREAAARAARTRRRKQLARSRAARRGANRRR